MALTNSQYNAVMREYEKRQLENRRRQQAHIAEVYKKLPAVEELDKEISSQSAAAARRALGGDTQARTLLRQEVRGLQAKKLQLLCEAGFSPEYLEMSYTCGDCQDTGYRDGVRCHCFERARIGILYAQSNIQEVLQRENFSRFSFAYYEKDKEIPGLGISEWEYMQHVVKRCKEFADHYPENGKNLLFMGTTGVGKTFLTNCIAKELIDRFVSVIYLTSHDLFELFSRSTFGKAGDDDGAQETSRHILECDMLIIDDLGTEMNNTFVSSQLFYCINERINRDKGTIISTNLSMDMLRDTYSDRVTSRMMSHYTTIPLYGEDIRMKKKRRSLD